MPNKINNRNESQPSEINIVIEPKKTLVQRKFIRLGTMVWAKLDGWPWWPGKAYLNFFF